MATPFDAWLRSLAAAGKGPLTLYAARKVKFTLSVNLPGNWTGAALRGKVKDAPDNAATLATFTVTGPVVVGAISTFTVSLAAGTAANSTGVLPADPDADGVTQFAYDLLLTPSGGTEELLVGGIFELEGSVTA